MLQLRTKTPSDSVSPIIHEKMSATEQEEIQGLSNEQLLASIQQSEKAVQNILKYQGFHDIEEQIKNATDANYKTPSQWQSLHHLPTNDLMFATISAPTEALNNVATGLVNNAIVSALILTISASFQ